MIKAGSRPKSLPIAGAMAGSQNPARAPVAWTRIRNTSTKAIEARDVRECAVIAGVQWQGAGDGECAVYSNVRSVSSVSPGGRQWP